MRNHYAPGGTTAKKRKAKQRKILIFNENRDFLFSPNDNDCASECNIEISRLSRYECSQSSLCEATQKSALHNRLGWSRRWSKHLLQIANNLRLESFQRYVTTRISRHPNIIEWYGMYKCWRKYKNDLLRLRYRVVDSYIFLIWSRTIKYIWVRRMDGL